MHRKILIVDDDAALRMIFARELKRDFDVTLVAGADDALGAMAETAFDAVMTDLSLGDGMDGLHLLVEVQKRAPRCARLLVTGSIADNAVDEALSGVVHRLITKPWPPKKLGEIVASVIDDVTTGAE